MEPYDTVLAATRIAPAVVHTQIKDYVDGVPNRPRPQKGSWGIVGVSSKKLIKPTSPAGPCRVLRLGDENGLSVYRFKLPGRAVVFTPSQVAAIYWAYACRGHVPVAAARCRHEGVPQSTCPVCGGTGYYPLLRGPTTTFPVSIGIDGTIQMATIDEVVAERIKDHLPISWAQLWSTQLWLTDTWAVVPNLVSSIAWAMRMRIREAICAPYLATNCWQGHGFVSDEVFDVESLGYVSGDVQSAGRRRIFREIWGEWCDHFVFSTSPRVQTEVDAKNRVEKTSISIATKRGSLVVVDLPERSSDAELTIMTHVEDLVSAYERVEDVERVALDNADEGETLRSALGHFEEGDEVWVRSSEDAELAGVVQLARFGKVLLVIDPQPSKNQLQPLIRVEHGNGQILDWHPGSLKLWECVPEDQRPEYRSDFGASDNAFLAQFRAWAKE